MSGLQLWVVDDNDDDRYLVSALLQQYTSHPVFAEGFKDSKRVSLRAEEIYQARKAGHEVQWPDVILTDVFLPDIDGLQLIRILRGYGCMTPAIIMSNVEWRTSLLKRALPENHVIGILKKPLESRFLNKLLDMFQEGSQEMLNRCLQTPINTGTQEYAVV